MCGAKRRRRGYERGGANGIRGRTWLVGVAVLVQVLLAGLGVFTYPGFFFWHANVNGSVAFFLPLLLVGWPGRVSVRLLGQARLITVG